MTIFNSGLLTNHPDNKWLQTCDCCDPKGEPVIDEGVRHDVLVSII